MPRYDYECPAGHEFEELRAMDERASAPCPTCGEQARKLPNAAQIGAFYGKPHRGSVYRHKKTGATYDAAVDVLDFVGDRK